MRDFEVIDIFPYGVEVSWEKDGEKVSSVVFPRNGPLPSLKSLTFFKYAAAVGHASAGT